MERKSILQTYVDTNGTDGLNKKYVDKALANGGGFGASAMETNEHYRQQLSNTQPGKALGSRDTRGGTSAGSRALNAAKSALYGTGAIGQQRNSYDDLLKVNLGTLDQEIEALQKKHRESAHKEAQNRRAKIKDDTAKAVTETNKAARNRLAELKSLYNLAERAQYEKKGEEAVAKVAPAARAQLEKLYNATRTEDKSHAGQKTAENWTAQQALQSRGAQRQRERDEARAALAQMGYKKQEIDQLLDYYSRMQDKARYLETYQNAAGAVNKSVPSAVGANVASVGTNLLSGAGQIDLTLQKLEQALSKDQWRKDAPLNYYSEGMLPYAWTQGVRQTTSGKILYDEQGKLRSQFAPALNTLYQAGMSMADSAAVMALTLAGVPEGLGLGLLGGAAATDAMVQAVERGASDTQAILTGAAAGVAEAAWEKISLDNVLSLKALAKTEGKETARRVLARQLFNQAKTEGLEEVATDLTNFVTDAIINGDMSDFMTGYRENLANGMSEQDAKNAAWRDFIKQVAVSGVMGFVTGGIMGASMTGLQGAIANSQAKETYSNQTDALLQRAEDLQINNTDTETLRKKGKAATGGEIRAVVEDIVRAEIKQTQDTLADRIEVKLDALGETGDTKKIAKALAARLTVEQVYADKALEQLVATQELEDELGRGAQRTMMRSPAAQLVYQQELAQNEARSVLENAPTRESANAEEVLAEASVPSFEEYFTSLQKINPGITEEEAQQSYETLSADRDAAIENRAKAFAEENREARVYLPDVGFVDYNTFREITRDLTKKDGSAYTEAERETAFLQGAEESKEAWQKRQQEIREQKQKRQQEIREQKKEQLTRVSDKINRAFEKRGLGLKTRVSFDENDFINENGIVQNAYVSPTGEIVFNGNAMTGEASVLWYLGHEVLHPAADADPELVKLVLETFQTLQRNGKLSEELSQRLADMDAEVERVRQLYQRNEDQIAARENRAAKTITEEQAREELAADLMRYAFQQSKLFEEIVNEKPGLAVRMRQAVQRLIRALKGDSSEGETEVQEALQKLADRMDAALVKAGQERQSLSDIESLQAEDLPKADLAKAENTSGQKLFSLTTMKQDLDGYMQDLRDADLAGEGKALSEKELQDLYTAINHLMDYAEEHIEEIEPKESYRNMTAKDRPFSPYKKNSDPHYKMALDFSTLCRKRLLAQAITEKLQQALKRSLTPVEQVRIRNEIKKLKEEGKKIDVACALCYVEAARLKTPKVINAFLNNRAAAMAYYFSKKDETFNKEVFAARVADWKKGHGLRPDAKKADVKDAGGTKLETELNRFQEKVRGKYMDWLQQTDPVRYAKVQSEIQAVERMDVGDFLSADSLARMKTEHPDVYQAFIQKVVSAARNKAMETDVPYVRGDIKSVSQRLINLMNEESGFRHQSWSDFQAMHLLDTIAAIIELSTRRAKVHAYTKVPDLVRFLGDTGLMLNMSLIPAGDTGLNENGELIFDPEEGMDYDTMLDLRRRFHATAGNIAIGINDKQIKALLASPEIDYVIPYHISGLNADMRRRMGIRAWEDYTRTQNEKLPSDKIKAPVLKEWFDEKEALTAVDGNAYMQKASKKYLALCKERGIVPKFPQFLVRNADGSYSLSEDAQNYWKLLVDRKMVDQTTDAVIIQKPVLPRFNEQVMMDILTNEVTSEAARDAREAEKIIVDRLLNDPRSFTKAEREAAKALTEVAARVAVENAAREMEEGRQFSLENSPTPVKEAPTAAEVETELQNHIFDNPSIGEDVKFSLRTEKAPEVLRTPDGDVKYVYKAFYAIDGKLYPPMVANLTDKEQRKLKNAVSGTMRGLDTPMGVWLNADIGEIARYKTDATEYDVVFRKLWSGKSRAMQAIKRELTRQGRNIRTGLKPEDRAVAQEMMEREFKELREASKTELKERAGDIVRNEIGRLAVVNSKSGGTLAFRPGWHLGEWPDAKQFNKDSHLGPRTVMPRGLVFAKCEIAAGIDYQLDAMEMGMKANGKYDRTQAGLPFVPVDGYYKYRTNPDSNTAPWYITGAMRVVEILDDNDSAAICKEYGVEMSPREDFKKIDLAEFGLKRGPVTAAEDLDAYAKTESARRNERVFQEALADDRYSDAYTPRDINFDDPEVRAEFTRNGQDVESYRRQYESRNQDNRPRFSLGDGYTAYGPDAAWTEQSLDNHIHDYSYGEKRSKAYAVRMRLDDFLKLTTDNEENTTRRANIERQARENPEYGGQLDVERLSASEDRETGIFLDVNLETGRVEGHEGRHRAVLMLDAGVETAPVLITNYKHRYEDKGIVPSMTLWGQRLDWSKVNPDARARNRNNVTVENLIPVSEGFREELTQAFATPADSSALRYSLTTGEDDERLQEFIAAYEAAMGDGQAEVDYPTLSQKLRAAERARKAAQALLEKETAKRTRAETTLKNNELAWQMYHKRVMRTKDRTFRAKLDAERQAKKDAVREAIQNTKDMERAKAEVKLENQQLAERMNAGKKAAKRLKIAENTYGNLKQETREKQKLQRNAARNTLKDQRLAGRKRSQEEEKQGPVSTLRKTPLERRAAEAEQTLAQRLRTMGRSLYAKFVSASAAVERVARRQKGGVRASTLVSIVGGVNGTVDTLYTQHLVNRSGDVIGDSMKNVFLMTEKNGTVVDEDRQALLQDYLLHLHNIDRMSFVEKARNNLEAFEAENPWLAEMDPKELAKLVAMTDTEVQRLGKNEARALARQYDTLLRAFNEAEDKPVFADENGNPVTAQTSRGIVADYEAKNPWLKNKSEGIYGWWDKFMRSWVVGDSITEAQYDRMREMYPHYVPTYRVNKGGLSFSFANQSGATPGRLIKTATGSVREIVNVEDSFANLVQKAVKQARVNELYKNLIDTAMLDNDGTFADMMYFDWLAYGDRVEQETDEDLDVGERVTRMEQSGLTKDSNGFRVSAWYDGELVPVYVSEELFNSLKNTVAFGNDRLSAVTKLGTKLTAPMKTAITGINPNFALRNMMRDLPTAVINSISGMAFPVYWARAWREMLAKSDHWRNYRALGGGSALYYNNEGGFGKALNMEDSRKGKAQRGWNKVKTNVGLLNESTEAVTRFAEYLATIDKLGDTYENRLLGIKNAAEVTVDFSRHGEYGQAINAWIPYWNPAVQGIDKVFRSVFETPEGQTKLGHALRTLGRAGVTTALLEVVMQLIYAALGRRDDWEELNDRMKDTYYCIPLADEHRFFKIPKNREWGAILGTPIMRLIEGYNGRENPFEGYIETSLLPNFLPGKPSDMIGFSQLIDLKTNKDFAGRAIVPYAYQQGTKAGQYDSETSVFTKWVSDAIGNKISPMQLDFILKDYFGDFGKMATMLTSRGFIAGEKTPEEVGDYLLDVVKSPWFADNRYSNQYTSKYYNTITELKQTYNDKKNHTEGDSYKDSLEYKTAQAMEKLYGKQISDLSKSIRDESDEEVKNRVKGEISSLAREALEFYEDSMSGKIKDPALTVKYNELPGDIGDELIRLDGLSKEYAFAPTTTTTKSYVDPTSKVKNKATREYVLDDKAVAKRDDLRKQYYNSELSQVIGSSTYRNASDTKKAEMLEEARAAAYDRAKEDFLAWLYANYTATPRK